MQKKDDSKLKVNFAIFIFGFVFIVTAISVIMLWKTKLTTPIELSVYCISVALLGICAMICGTILCICSNKVKTRNDDNTIDEMLIEKVLHCPASKKCVCRKNRFGHYNANSITKPKS